MIVEIIVGGARRPPILLAASLIDAEAPAAASPIVHGRSDALNVYPVVSFTEALQIHSPEPVLGRRGRNRTERQCDEGKSRSDASVSHDFLLFDTVLCPESG
jgi:hypothetical protein